jgi:hypothetical protein
VWTELTQAMAGFPDAVLRVNAQGFPLSVRCRPRLDPALRVLHVDRAPGVALLDGPASLLCHSHDRNLWRLRSFLVRGQLTTTGTTWVFHPVALVAGTGLSGPVGDVRSFWAARQRAGRYLARRGLTRPTVPWQLVRDTARRGPGAS